MHPDDGFGVLVDELSRPKMAGEACAPTLELGGERSIENDHPSAFEKWGEQMHHQNSRFFPCGGFSPAR
jgi:hypothetical protein